jgi:ubiquinone/menaquinone biosynthesis C-methylase UbiE
MGYTAFDHFVAWCRFRVAAPHVRHDSRVCDLGCGSGAPFLNHIASRLQLGVGIDEHVGRKNHERILIVRADIASTLPVGTARFDHVTMLAVLEHLQHPDSVLSEAHRILRPGGSLILTWPSAAVDPILSLLTRIGIVNNDLGFEQHQPRIPLESLMDRLRRIGFGRIKDGTFELGLNNWLVAHKDS